MYEEHLDLALLKKAPDMTEVSCAEMCIQQPDCIAFAFQARLQFDTTPNICITYVCTSADPASVLSASGI